MTHRVLIRVTDDTWNVKQALKEFRSDISQQKGVGYTPVGNTTIEIFAELSDASLSEDEACETVEQYFEGRLDICDGPETK